MRINNTGFNNNNNNLGFGLKLNTTKIDDGAEYIYPNIEQGIRWAEDHFKMNLPGNEQCKALMRGNPGEISVFMRKGEGRTAPSAQDTLFNGASPEQVKDFFVKLHAKLSGNPSPAKKAVRFDKTG